MLGRGRGSSCVWWFWKAVGELLVLDGGVLWMASCLEESIELKVLQLVKAKVQKKDKIYTCTSCESEIVGK